jgi:hypothetical protein
MVTALDRVTTGALAFWGRDEWRVYAGARAGGDGREPYTSSAVPPVTRPQLEGPAAGRPRRGGGHGRDRLGAG